MSRSRSRGLGRTLKSWILEPIQRIASNIVEGVAAREARRGKVSEVLEVLEVLSLCEPILSPA